MRLWHTPQFNQKKVTTMMSMFNFPLIKKQLWKFILVASPLICIAGPAAPDVTKVPQPFLEEHQGWVDIYFKAFQIAFSKIHKGTTLNDFVDYYIDEGFNPNIFQWDTIFMMMFARYANGELPSVVSLENFYRKQDNDGWICREIRETDGTNFWPKSGNVSGQPSWTSDCSINPPLFSWAEWENYQVTGDSSRFTKLINGKTIFQRLVDYFYWVKKNRRWENQLYWTTSWANGMDDNPRLNPGVGTSSGLPVCDNAGGSWIDITTQQAMNALYLSRIAAVLGKDSLKQVLVMEHEQLKKLINEKMWDAQDGFYYDIDKNGQFYKVKTPASFWTLLAQITDDSKAKKLVEHIVNPNEFWTPHHIPTVSKDDPHFQEDGGYWDGAVWAPTTYQTIRGLHDQGYQKVARDIATNHLENLFYVYNTTKTLYENYQPVQPLAGERAKDEFVGWTGCGPIACLIENVMGIHVNGPNDSLEWDILLAEHHGITNLQFGDNTVSLTCEDRLTPDSGAAVTITTNSPFKLHATVGKKEFNELVPTGTSKYLFGTIEPGLNSIRIMHSGVGGNGFGNVTGEVYRYQTFVADTNPYLRGVDVKIKKLGGTAQSDVTVELYSVQNSKPTGNALASATIASSDIDNFYCVVHANITYDQLKSGSTYAIVLGQKNKQTSIYSWVNGVEVMSYVVAGKGDGNGNWTVETQLKNCWAKIYTRKDLYIPSHATQNTVFVSNVSLGIQQLSDMKIRYTVPALSGNGQTVTIKLFNCSGRFVKVLDTGTKRAGVYTIDLGNSTRGSAAITQGMYLCTIDSKNGSKSCKVVVR
jgi:hypothetical protein